MFVPRNIQYQIVVQFLSDTNGCKKDWIKDDTITNKKHNSDVNEGLKQLPYIGNDDRDYIYNNSTSKYEESDYDENIQDSCKSRIH